jgi:hypothetical protein
MNRYWLAAKHTVNHGYQRLHLTTGWTAGRPTAVHAATSLRCFLRCRHCNLWKTDHILLVTKEDVCDGCHLPPTGHRVPSWPAKHPQD